MKPKHSLQKITRCISCGDPLHELWDRDRKTARDKFGKKRKSTGFFLPGSEFHEAEGHLSMRSCLQDAVINSAPRIGKYIYNQELYRHSPPRKLKHTNISEIENTSCVRNVMKMTPVSVIETEPWGVAFIIIIVNDGVFICTCNIKSDEYNC